MRPTWATCWGMARTWLLSWALLASLAETQTWTTLLRSERQKTVPSMRSLTLTQAANHLLKNLQWRTHLLNSRRRRRSLSTNEKLWASGTALTRTSAFRARQRSSMPKRRLAGKAISESRNQTPLRPRRHRLKNNKPQARRLRLIRSSSS